jgi:hypothetical protein
MTRKVIHPDFAAFPNRKSAGIPMIKKSEAALETHFWLFDINRD